ncbi:MAG: ATP-binding protein [Pseudomonadota bacterium]
MKREAISTLSIWKKSANRKPLIIRGARQVGKTWLMQEFGRQHYAQTVYINFDNDPRMAALFRIDMDCKRILMGLELVAGHAIDIEKTLLIFDEIQAVPQALASLKYFYETMPECHIICAGSLLGVALHEGTSFPVGKVDFLDLRPMSFIEFLQATGKTLYAESIDRQDWGLLTSFKTTLIEALKHYFVVGGMPEAVAHFAEHHDFNRVRAIQTAILTAYEQDFSKHAPTAEVPRLRMLWNSIPSQLSKENKKFVYGVVRKGSRAKDYEMALLWLADCGLVHCVHRITAPRLPLRSYEERAFKLFLLDVGLLGCMARLAPQIILDGDALFTEFKGALTEQYVLQELLAYSNREELAWPKEYVTYWGNDAGTAEIDFVVDNSQGNAFNTHAGIIPIEVKATQNLQAKSLKVYREKYQPAQSIRTSLADYKEENGLVNIPLYAFASVMRREGKV